MQYPLLIGLGLLSVCTVSVHSIAYSCQELKNGKIPVSGYKVACVVVERNQADSLITDNLYFNDGQTGLSFTSISSDKTHCKSTTTSWTYQSKLTGEIDCTIEFVIILVDTPVTIIAVIEDDLPQSLIGEVSYTMVSPRGGMRFTQLKSNKAVNSTTTFYSGAGIGEDEQFFMANYSNADLPSIYFAFEPIVTIHNSPQTGFTSFSVTSDYKETLEDWSRKQKLIVSNSGKASNLQNSHAADNVITIVPYDPNALVGVHPIIFALSSSEHLVETYSVTDADEIYKDYTITNNNASTYNIVVPQTLKINYPTSIPASSVGKNPETFLIEFTYLGNVPPEPSPTTRGPDTTTTPGVTTTPAAIPTSTTNGGGPAVSSTTTSSPAQTTTKYVPPPTSTAAPTTVTSAATIQSSTPAASTKVTTPKPPRTTTQRVQPTTTKYNGNGTEYGGIEYCACVPHTMWIDIVFLVDSSQAMKFGGLKEVESVIRSILYDLSLGDYRFQTRAGIVVYGDTAQKIYDLEHIRTWDDIDDIFIPYYGTNTSDLASAINIGYGMLLAGSRTGTKQALVVIASSFRSDIASDPGKIASQFKEDGGTIITFEYVQQGESALPGLEAIASPYYTFSTLDEDDFTGPTIMQALCDVNCYCPLGQEAYTNGSLRNTPMGGCYESITAKAVYHAAKITCTNKNGIMACPHDSNKQFFLMGLFAGSKIPYWIGYEKINGAYQWADNSTNPYTNWDPSNDFSVGPCTYSQQNSGFKSLWHSAPCMDIIKADYVYPCELRPCDTTYYCF